MLSVLQYAVEVLRVQHVIVCGHYGCGGIKAAMTNVDLGLINKWLRNIKNTYRLHQAELELIEDNDRRGDRLAELSVEEQIINLAKTSIIQHAWQSENRPILHGWIYRLTDGILHDIIKMDADTSRLDPFINTRRELLI